jgi:hypothetical protein
MRPTKKPNESNPSQAQRDLTKAEVKALSDQILSKHVKVMDALAKL